MSRSLMANLLAVEAVWWSTRAGEYLWLKGLKLHPSPAFNHAKGFKPPLSIPTTRPRGEQLYYTLLCNAATF